MVFSVVQDLVFAGVEVLVVEVACKMVEDILFDINLCALQSCTSLCFPVLDFLAVVGRICDIFLLQLHLFHQRLHLHTCKWMTVLACDGH